MTHDALIEMDRAPVWTEAEPKPANLLRVGDLWQYNDSLGMSVAELLAYPPVAAAGPSLVGEWDTASGAIVQIDAGRYSELANFGNSKGRPVTDKDGNPVGETGVGMAQTSLLTGPVIWQGQAMRKVEGDKVYPSGSEPFLAAAEHRWVDDEPWSGYGFRYEIRPESEGARDPSVRSIGVYADPECTQYLWTPGALQVGPSEFWTDDDGQPLTVYYSETPPGQRKAEPDPWYIALLWTSAQEGWIRLYHGAGIVEAQYFPQTQVRGHAKGKGQRNL